MGINGNRDVCAYEGVNAFIPPDLFSQSAISRMCRQAQYVILKAGKSIPVSHYWRHTMEPSITQDQAGYFLAGHLVPPGIYQEAQTGREIQIEEPGILPATCDGHVAVYVRRPATWAEIAKRSGLAVKKETH